VLRREGAEISTLDLFGRGFVLLAGCGDDAWCSTALGAAKRLGLPLDLCLVGGPELADPDGRFADAYGISAAGAVIVRPDGVVAWRAPDATGISLDCIQHVLAALVCRRDAVAPGRVEGVDGDFS
jgi:putative polyketide hydroxylase